MNALDLAECLAVLRERAPEMTLNAYRWSDGGWTAYIHHPASTVSVAVLDARAGGDLEMSFHMPESEHGWLFFMRCRPAEALSTALNVRAGQPVEQTPGVNGRRPIWRPK